MQTWQWLLEAIKSLKDKCLKSCFCKPFVDDMINITAEWKDRFGPPMKKAREINENLSIFLPVAAKWYLLRLIQFTDWSFDLT